MDYKYLKRITASLLMAAMVIGTSGCSDKIVISNDSDEEVSNEDVKEDTSEAEETEEGEDIKEDTEYKLYFKELINRYSKKQKEE